MIPLTTNTYIQCYQIAKLFVQYLAIDNNEIVSNCIKLLAKYAQNFANQKNAKYY